MDRARSEERRKMAAACAACWVAETAELAWARIRPEPATPRGRLMSSALPEKAVPPARHASPESPESSDATGRALRIFLWHVHGSWTTSFVQGPHRYFVPVLPVRWTSLGLALIEAMLLGMPVVALATTEMPEAVPPDAGVASTRIDVLASGLRRFVADPEAAAVCGKAARAWALERYGLERFLLDWDRLLGEVVR
jgi:glycosyl transferase family 1